MSVQALTWALATATPSPTTKLVLLLLANYADEFGVAWPSVRRIGNESGLSERAIRNAIHALMDAELLTKEHQRRPNGSKTVDLYTLNLPAAFGAASDGFRDPASGTTCRTLRHQMPVPPARRAGPEPSLEPSSEKKESIVRSEPESFTLWWESYPRKAAKLKAVEAYRKTLAQGLATAEELLAGAQVYAQARAGQDPQFTKLPTTWLNGGCWADEPAVPPPRNGHGPHVRESGLDWAASRLAGEAMK
jgi:hypothetical protein